MTQKKTMNKREVELADLQTVNPNMDQSMDDKLDNPAITFAGDQVDPIKDIEDEFNSISNRGSENGPLQTKDGPSKNVSFVGAATVAAVTANKSKKNSKKKE